MPAIATLHDLMVHQLQDLYSAERQLVKALPKVARSANAPELQEAIRAHLTQTEEHVTRLEDTLNEEKEAGKLLTTLAEGGVNALAMRDGLETMGSKDR